MTRLILFTAFLTEQIRSHPSLWGVMSLSIMSFPLNLPWEFSWYVTFPVHHRWWRSNLYWLKSFEGQVIEVHEDVSLQSPLVSKQAKEAGGVIQLEGADTRSLRKVIVWCKGRTPAYKAAILSELLREWEDEFADPCRVPDCLRMLHGDQRIGELCVQQDRGRGTSNCREGPGGKEETGSRRNMGRKKFVKRWAG